MYDKVIIVFSKIHGGKTRRKMYTGMLAVVARFLSLGTTDT